MTAENKEPNLPRLQLPCLRCNHPTWHEVVARGDSRIYMNDGASWSAEIYQVVRCPGCRTHSFMVSDADSSLPEGTNTGWSLYPPRGDMTRPWLEGFHHLPSHLLPLYRETHDALRASQPILAAVGIRALVEAVCRHKRVSGRTLKQRIDALTARGILTPIDAAALHRTRFLGNRVAHQAAPASEAVLHAAMRIVDHLLASTYVIRRVAAGLPKN